jgi:hypothetical protein
MLLASYRLPGRGDFAESFFAGRGGGRFAVRFNLDPRARCALRVGEGPRALGFSIVLLKISSSSASSWSYSLDCNDIVSDAHQVSRLEACLPS